MNDEQKNESETPEKVKEQGAPEETHEWNIEEFSQDIIEQRPPNDKIIKFGIPDEESEEDSQEKKPSRASEPINAPKAPEENP